MRIELTVCNICQDPGRSTEEYAVTKGKRSGKVDLCTEHGAMLEVGMAEPEPKVTKAPATRGRGARGIKITTPAEIERLKATG